MTSKPCCLVVGILVCLASIAPLRAEIASFPKDQPVFKTEIPSGYAATQTETSLYLRPTAADTSRYADASNYFFAFIALPASDVSDEASAKKYVESYRASELKKLNMEEEKTPWPVAEEELPNGLKGWSADSDSFLKINKGDLPQMRAFTAIVFSPNGKDYYLMEAFGLSGAAAANKDFLKKSIVAAK